MPQLVTRIDDQLAKEVDEMIATGFVESRSEAVRMGLERLIDRFRRNSIGAQIVEGYKRQPQTHQEVGWADSSTKSMIGEDPW